MCLTGVNSNVPGARDEWGGDLESPYLDGGIPAGGDEEVWEARLAALVAEVPYLRATERMLPLPVTRKDDAKAYPGETEYSEGVKEESSERDVVFADGTVVPRGAWTGGEEEVGRVTVYLGSPSPVRRRSWAERASPENRQRAQALDEIEKRNNSELTKLREEVAVKAVGPVGPAQEAALRKLEDIEAIAAERGIPPRREHYSPYSRGPVARRLNVRAFIEEGIHRSGSFKQALKEFGTTKGIESDIEYFTKERDRFASAFKAQVRLAADRMLDGSQIGIRNILRSYGLPYENAQLAAQRLARHGDTGKEADLVITIALKAQDVDASAYVKNRKSLADQVARLRRLQEAVKQRERESNLADLDLPMNMQGPKVQAAKAAKARLRQAVIELRTAWIVAERLHSVIASLRRGGDLDKVDLKSLDTAAVGDQMKTVLMELLPKLRDIGKARYQLQRGTLNPLTLPSVVALARATMFIPKGSFRDGIVNDLARDAADDADATLIKVLAFALAVITLIPSAGASLAIPAGAAAVSLAAYTASREWDKFTRAKTYANTDIDLARSLATEDPSLTGFAVSLVGLGLEALPLVTAFNKARKLRALVARGEDTRAAVRELNAIGAARGNPRLGDEALEEIRITTKPPPKPSVPAKRVIPPVKPKLGSVGTLGFNTAKEVRNAVIDGLSKLKSGMNPKDLPRDWPLMIKALTNNPGPVNRQLLDLVPTVMGGLRDPKLYADVLADAFERARRINTNISTGLVHLARDSGLPVTVIKSGAGLLDGKVFFGQYASRPLHFVDKALAKDPGGHGAMTHILQDLVVDRALRSAGKNLNSGQFRALLGKAEGTVKAGKRAERMATGDYVWRATYDQIQIGHLPTPESLWPILSKLLKLK